MGGNRKILKAKRRNENIGSGNESKKKNENQKNRPQQQQQSKQKKKKSYTPEKKVRIDRKNEQSKDKLDKAPKSDKIKGPVSTSKPIKSSLKNAWNIAINEAKEKSLAEKIKKDLKHDNVIPLPQTSTTSSKSVTSSSSVRGVSKNVTSSVSKTSKSLPVRALAKTSSAYSSQSSTLSKSIQDSKKTEATNREAAAAAATETTTGNLQFKTKGFKIPKKTTSRSSNSVDKTSLLITALPLPNLPTPSSNISCSSRSSYKNIILPMATTPRLSPSSSSSISNSYNNNNDIPINKAPSSQSPTSSKIISSNSSSSSYNNIIMAPSPRLETSFSSSSSSSSSNNLLTPPQNIPLFSMPTPPAANTVTESDSDVAEFEDMEWETTRQAVISLWEKRTSNEAFNSENLEDENEMEVDSFETLIIVPDTNIWIHSLSLIRELLDTKFRYHSYPTIVIPWMVLQELDVQGKVHRGPSRQSIVYIHKLLSSKHPRVRGQKASDACIDVPHYDRHNADDSILQCVQQQKENCNSATVILLTDDRNMLNKALVNNILGVDSKRGVGAISEILSKGTSSNKDNSFVQRLPVTTVLPSPQNFNFNKLAFETNNNNVGLPQFKFGSPSVPVLTSSGISTTTPSVTTVNPVISFKPGQKRPRSPPIAMFTSNDSKKYKCPSEQQQQEAEVHNFQEVLGLLQRVFSHIIETKMKEDFGENGWLTALKIRPPWTLITATQCLIKHWLAVFSEVFGRRPSQAEKLVGLLKAYETRSHSRTPEMEQEIIECVLGLFATGEFAQSTLVKTDQQVRSCRQVLLAYNKKINSVNKQAVI